MRSIAASFLLLAGCGGEADAPGAPVPEEQRIACALDGAAEFERVCGWEQQDERITLRRPDGGFRRILAGPEGIEAADGAEPVRVERVGPGIVEIAVAGDRYRLPVATP